ncbi:MAG: phage tail tape measure protein [Streptomyces sp.]|nr:phage tail tape measure protein [Streptomyces sp.]
MSEVGDLYVVLRAVTAPFKRGMAEAAAEGEASTTRIGGAFKKLAGIGMVAGAASIAIGAVSVKWAADFQAQMTRLYTAAGLSNEQLQKVHMTSSQLNDQVLKLGTQVGFTGTQMAEALYHPISAGLDLKSALAVVTEAAKEAKISGASLEDTTYSLSSVMKAFNEPASAAKSTMASLNAIVGQGDMRFQDFNESIKNWAPTAAQMGISINSMGSGLAYLTDRGNSAEVAATRLTMGISMMTTPSQKATKMLTGLGLASTDVKASSSAMQKAMQAAGITQNKLAMDLKKPDGLYVALKDLKDGLHKAGVSGTEADSVLAKIFGGGRSDKAIMSLMQNLDGLKTKFEDIQKASKESAFDAAWTKTQKTFQNQLHQTEAALVNMGIRLGTMLLPYVQEFLGWVRTGVVWLSQHKGAVMALAGALGTTLVAAIIAVGTALYASIGPELAIAAGIMAVGAAVVYAYNHFKTFRTIVNDIGRFLATQFKLAWQVAGMVVHWFATTVIPAARTAINGLISWFSSHKQVFTGAWSSMVHTVQGLVTWFNTNVLVWVKARIAGLTAWWKQHGDQIRAIAKVVFAAIGLYAKMWWDTMKPLLAVLAAAWTNAWGLIRDTAKVAWAVISGVATTAMHLILNTVGLILDLITGKWSRVWGDLKRLVGQQLHDVASTIMSVGSSFGTLLYNAGASVIHGLISGIKSSMGSLGSVLGDIGGFITSHKGPPSYDKVMLTPAGRMIMQGLVDGLNSHLPVLAAATANVGATIESSFAKRMGIASPSKVFRSLGIYLNEGLIDGLTGSTARVKAATRRIESLLVETYNRVSDLRGSGGRGRKGRGMNAWVDAHEHTIKRLEAYARHEDTVLRGLAAKRDSVAKKIKDAQKALAAVQKQWSTEVKNVSDGIMQGFSIVTQAPQEGFALTAQDVVNNMRDQMSKAVNFAAELKTLQKKGLSADLVAQIAAAGVDQGGETAAALSRATKGQIQQINQIQTATKSAATSAGTAVADSMYGSGLRAAQGLVKGLQHQEKAIEKQMLRIAESMKKAIKRALGIRSPSTVFAEIGQWIPRGLAKGVEGGAHHAVGAVGSLASAVVGAGRFAGSGLAMAGAGGGGPTYNLTIQVEGHVLTERGLRDVVEQSMLRLGMRNSTTYAAYKR